MTYTTSFRALDVFGDLVGQLAVTGVDRLGDDVGVEWRLGGEAVHPGDEVGQGVGDDEVRDTEHELGDRSGRAGPQPLQQEAQAPDGLVGGLLAAGPRALPIDDER